MAVAGEFTKGTIGKGVGQRDPASLEQHEVWQVKGSQHHEACGTRQ